jgi:hypothetical protein
LFYARIRSLGRAECQGPPWRRQQGRRVGQRAIRDARYDQIQRLLAAPELVVRTWAAAKREGEDIAEREVTVLLADFATVWIELFPAEQARIVQLLVERVDVKEDALEVRIRAEGLASLVGELQQGDERPARAA